MARPLPRLETARLILRLAEESDASSIVDYYESNREHLTPFEPMRPQGFYTRSFWAAQAGRNRDDFHAEQALRLFVFRKDLPQTVIGYVGYSGLTRGAAHFCFLGYSLAEREQGNGYMTEAVRESIEYVFRDLRLHRIMANYMPHNIRSGRLLRRLDFVVEGYARDYLMINGHWEDHILTSLTNPYWSPL